MANTVIQLKHSTLTGNVPSSLANGEISINSRDGKFFYSTPAGAVVTHYPYPGPAGLNQEIQFNDSGVLGSNSGLTFSKTTGVFTAPIVASSNNGQGTNFKVGDDVWLGDINLSDTLSIRGQQNVNNAYISFGASNANTLGRAGTGPLTYTGAFTATGIISGSEISATQSSGDEGGQINLALAATNTTLSGSVAIDIYQNRLRIFETSGSNRGVFIDLANGASSSVGTNLLSSSTSTDTFARNQANAAFLQANTPSATANSAASYANSAFLRANTPSDVANSAASYANSAFTRANSSLTSANGTIIWNTANAAFTAANAATATDTTQNNSITASFNTANAAFTRANNSLDANNGGTVTGTITATSFITTGSFGNILGANTIYANNFVANTGFIQFADGTRQFTANGGNANLIAAAFNTANAAFLQANTPSHVANSAAIYANGAFAAANAATATDTTQNNSITAAFASANAAFIRANNSLNANTGGSITGDILITGNLTVTGNTTYTNTITVLIGDNIIVLNADVPQSAQPTESAGIEIDRGAQPNSSFLWIETSGKWAANNGNGSIFIAADSAESYANSAFAAANAATATNTTQNNSITAAFASANAAFLQANTPSHVANSAAIYANGAFAAANAATATDTTQNNSITAAFASANAAFLAANAANATDTTQNNSITAAFARANNSINANTGGTISANLVIAGANLVVSNGATEVFNVRSWSTSGLPATSNSTGTVTITGGVGVKGSIYADAVYDGGIEIIAYANSIFLAANAATATDTTQNNSITAAFNTANAAFTAANAATATDTTQNNSITAAFNTANASFTVANNAVTSANGTIIWNTANAAFLAANSATATDTTQNNSITAAFLQANTPSHVANSAASYANSAFAAANSATAIDTTQNNSITAAFASANAAFTRANNSINANTGGTIAGDLSITGNLTVTGITTYTNTSTVLIADNIITVNAAISQSAQPAVNAGIEVDRGAQPNSSFLWIESSGKWAANNGNGSIFIAADSAESYANSAFAAANAASTTNLTQNNSITASFATANAAFLAANAATATDTTQNNSITAAFLQANTPSFTANSAAIYANGAFAQANTDFTTITTTAGTYGNATYVPVITLAANGRVTAITNTAVSSSGGASIGDVLALAIALG